MQIFDELNDDNFLLFAARHYNRLNCSDIEEFYDDMKRFNYLNRLFNKYKTTGQLSERLMLNHIIIIFNVFGIKPGLKMLEYKLGQDNLPVLKPFLVLLQSIRNDEYTHIKMDEYVVTQLRAL